MNTLGSFVFELCCGQTDKQTDGLERTTHTDRHDIVGVGNYNFINNDLPVLKHIGIFRRRLVRYHIEMRKKITTMGAHGHKQGGVGSCPWNLETFT